MSKYEKIEMRKIVPVAAMISAGKSKLLNVLYNINFLECKAGIGTKFVNILRYNPNITEPRFFHLRLKKQGEEYIFYKDNLSQDVTGEKNIIEENKNINHILQDDSIFKYENIFYMTEINDCPFIKDKKYLLTHDLCDIPGLSEYQGGNTQKGETEDKDKNEDKKEEKKDKNEEKKEEKKPNIENQLEEARNQFLFDEEEEIREENKEEKEQNIEKDLEKAENDEDENTNKEKKDEEEDEISKNIKVEENTYLSEIFKILKKYIDGAIIVLSIENYYFTTNFELIAKLQKVLNKELTNCLVILNKADLSSNLIEDINKCKGLFMKYFPNCKTFNLNLNTFIPLSAIQVQNELLLDKSFKHLLNYHFYNYMAKMKIEKSKNQGVFNKSFIDHLRDIISTEKDLTGEQIEKKVNELDNPAIDNEIIQIINDLKNEFKGYDINFGVTEEDFKKQENDEGDLLNLDIDEETTNTPSKKKIDEIKASYILKFLYIYQRENKLIPSPSEETINLINYFKVRPELPKDEDKKKADKTTEKTKLNKRIIKNLKSIAKEIKDSNFISNEINKIIRDIYQTVEFLKIYDVIFIPFLGPSNAGKTTIINGIIGEDILPADLNECTKRGIIIRYLDDNETEINIRKAVFTEEEYLGKKKYYFDPREVIAKGIKGVQDTVKGLNYSFADKEEDSFYYIRTKIRLFDELGLDDTFKKMIYLIDFPGHGTGNFFEKNKIYTKIMSICNSFVFVVRNSVIKENKNKELLEDIFTKAKKGQSKFSSGFIKDCLFILNNDNSQETKKEDLDGAKKDISELIKIEQKDIITFFFNAKFYSNYIDNYNYFYNIKNTFKQEFKTYRLYKNNIFKYPELYKEKTFNSFCSFILKEIKVKIQTGGFNKAIGKNEEIKENVKNDMNEVIEEFETNKYIKKDEFPNKYIDTIGKIFSFGQKNINELPTLKDSNIEELKKIFLNQINDVNSKLQEELKIKLNQVITTLNYFFNQDFSKREKDLKAFNEFKQSLEDIKNRMLSMSNSSKAEIDSIKTNYETKVIDSLKAQKENMTKLLITKNYKEIKKEIESQMEENIQKFTEEINSFFDDISYNSNMEYQKGKKLFAVFTENEILLDEFPNFKEYFAEKVSNKDGNISEELAKEIKNCFDEPMKKIYKENGLFTCISSMIFDDNYLKNILDLIIKYYTKHTNYILGLVSKSFKEYVDSIIEQIEIRKSIIFIRYTENQNHEWQKLCAIYQGKRENICKDVITICTK